MCKLIWTTNLGPQLELTHTHTHTHTLPLHRHKIQFNAKHKTVEFLYGRGGIASAPASIGETYQLHRKHNGAEIARTEWYREGRVPLHTLRADIDYATSEASTTYGLIGIKVWIFKGEILNVEDLQAGAQSK